MTKKFNDSNNVFTTAVKVLFGEFQINPKADAKEVALNIAKEQGVHAPVLQKLAPVLQQLASVVEDNRNLSEIWEETEKDALIHFVNILGDVMNKYVLYDLFAQLTKRTQSAVQNRYSLLTSTKGKQVNTVGTSQEKEVPVVKPASKKEKVAIMERAVFELYEKASLDFEGDIEKLLEEIAGQTQDLMKSHDFIALYNVFVMVKTIQKEREETGLEKEYEWTEAEDNLMFTCISTLHAKGFSNNRIFDVVSRLLHRGKDGGACYQRHKWLQEQNAKAKESAFATKPVNETIEKTTTSSEEKVEEQTPPIIQQVKEAVATETVVRKVETVHMRDAHVEHTLPQGIPGILDSTVSIINTAEIAGLDVDTLMHIVAEGVKKSVKQVQKEEYDSEKLELKLEVESLKFQVEELTKVTQILNKKLSLKDDEIFSLQGKLFDLYHTTDAKAILQLHEQKKQYAVDANGMVHRKSI